MLPSTRNTLTGKIITWRHMESTRYIQEEEEEGGRRRGRRRRRRKVSNRLGRRTWETHHT